MIRFAVILSLCATPLLAQTEPRPRPERVAAAVVEQVAVEEGTEALDRAAIAAQISGAIRACWNVSGLSEAAMAVSLRLGFETRPEGEVIRETIELIGYENGTEDAAEEALVQAFAAIIRCGNDGLDLPAETHAIWRRVEMTFDARSMVQQ